MFAEQGCDTSNVNDPPTPFPTPPAPWCFYRPVLARSRHSTVQAELVQQEAPRAFPCVPPSLSRKDGNGRVARPWPAIYEAPRVPLRLHLPGTGAGLGEFRWLRSARQSSPRHGFCVRKVSREKGIFLARGHNSKDKTAKYKTHGLPSMSFFSPFEFSALHTVRATPCSPPPHPPPNVFGYRYHLTTWQVEAINGVCHFNMRGQDAGKVGTT